MTTHYFQPSNTARTVIQQKNEQDQATRYNELKQKKRTIPDSSPVFVSDKMEDLSHSKTTMKLVPSYKLFQVLPEAEGGKVSESEIEWLESDGLGAEDSGYLLDPENEPVHLPDPFKVRFLI